MGLWREKPWFQGQCLGEPSLEVVVPKPPLHYPVCDSPGCHNVSLMPIATKCLCMFAFLLNKSELPSFHLCFQQKSITQYSPCSVSEMQYMLSSAQKHSLLPEALILLTPRRCIQMLLVKFCDEPMYIFQFDLPSWQSFGYTVLLFFLVSYHLMISSFLDTFLSKLFFSGPLFKSCQCTILHLCLLVLWSIYSLGNSNLSKLLF